MSLFGQQLLTVQYYCRDCQTPFERVKGPDVMEDAVESIRGRDEYVGRSVTGYHTTEGSSGKQQRLHSPGGAFDVPMD